MKYRSIFGVAALMAVLAGCGESAPPPTESKEAPALESRAPEAESSAYPNHPARGVLNGRKTTVERAQWKEGGILELRQGADIFADRKLMIFLFTDESVANREFGEQGAGMRPHVHVSWKDEGWNLPKTQTLSGAGEYSLALRFGEASEWGVPYEIRFSSDRLEGATELSGKGFATLLDIRLADGTLDRSFNSFDTLRYIAEEHLRGVHDGLEIEIVDAFATNFSSSNKPYPHRGFVGAEYRVAGGEIRVARVQMRKDEQGWKVGRQLAPEQIDEAHPLQLDPAEPNDPRSRLMLKAAAARHLEAKLNESGEAAALRITNFSGASQPERANFRIDYKLKLPDKGEVCRVENLMLVLDDGWRVERELPPDVQFNFRTGELEPYTLKSHLCS